MRFTNPQVTEAKITWYGISLNPSFFLDNIEQYKREYIINIKVLKI